MQTTNAMWQILSDHKSWQPRDNQPNSQYYSHIIGLQNSKWEAKKAKENLQQKKGFHCKSCHWLNWVLQERQGQSHNSSDRPLNTFCNVRIIWYKRHLHTTDWSRSAELGLCGVKGGRVKERRAAIASSSPHSPLMSTSSSSSSSSSLGQSRPPGGKA